MLIFFKKITKNIFTVFKLCMDSIHSISFKAIPGTEVIRRAAQEYGGDTARVNKFTALFKTTFADNLDSRTVVDVDKNERYIFSNINFPNIFYKSGKKLDRGRGINFSNSVIMACPKVLSTIEHKMIRTIIRKCLKSGISQEKMTQIAESNIENASVKKYFLDNLNIARRIIEKNPKSKLTFREFNEMEMIIFDELASIPGTPEYKIAHMI